MKACMLIVLSVLISACASNDFHDLEASTNQMLSVQKPTPPKLHHELFVDNSLHQKSIEQSDIFALAPEQRQQFLKYFNDHQHRDIRPHIRVANYIQAFSDGFSYQGDTVDAAKAFTEKNGNCLSLAILSTAFAQTAGLRFQYNRVHSAPIYQEYENVQLVSTHVNLTIFDAPQTAGDYWLSGAITIDYFRTKDSYISDVVTLDELKIMYWNNLASEAIIKGELNHAYSYTLAANNIDPLYPETLNLLAILYKRMQRSDLAYAVYDFMDTNNIVSFSAVDNFASLLGEMGDRKRAAELRVKIQHIIDDNPYTWLSRGKAHFEKGELRLAESYFLKSSAYGPYLHEPLYNLAKLYVKQNRFKKARTILLKAKELAYMPDDEKRLQAKIFSLK